MSSIEWTRLDGRAERAPAEEVGRLASELCGGVVVAGTPAHDEARTIWNAMVDRRPGIIAQCASTADVA